MNIKAALPLAAFLLLVPATSVRAQDAKPPGESKPEKGQSLQGAWEGVEVGRETEGKCRLTITGNAIDFKGATEKEWYKAEFTLVDGTEPKQLRATITECPVPDFVGKTGISIFKIENGKLTLVGNRPGVSETPKSFDADENSRQFVFTKTPSGK